MLRATIALAALLTCWTASAHAGLGLSWTSCVQDGGASNVDADCQTVGSYDLIGCFQLPVTLDCFYALSATIDLQVESSAQVPPFWHFEPGGCNPSGIGLMTNEGAVGGTCNALDPWVSPGVSGTVWLAQIVNPNRVRLRFVITRPTSSPVRLEAGQTYYAFHLRFSTDHSQTAGGACAGCESKVAIAWNAAELSSSGCADPGTTTLSDAGPGQLCVTWNGASAATCEATPVKASTWGQIKTIYR